MLETTDYNNPFDEEAIVAMLYGDGEAMAKAFADGANPLLLTSTNLSIFSPHEIVSLPMYAMERKQPRMVAQLLEMGQDPNRVVTEEDALKQAFKKSRDPQSTRLIHITPEEQKGVELHSLPPLAFLARLMDYDADNMFREGISEEDQKIYEDCASILLAAGATPEPKLFEKLSPALTDYMQKMLDGTVKKPTKADLEARGIDYFDPEKAIAALAAQKQNAAALPGGTTALGQSEGLGSGLGIE